MIRTVVTLIALLLLATAAQAQTLVDHYTAAMQARAAGDFAEYQAAMLRANEVEPDHPIVQIHLSRAAAQLAEFESAADWATRALKQGAWTDFAADEWFRPLVESEHGEAVIALAAKVGAHRGAGVVGFEVDDHDLLAEGIAYDSEADAFYLSSMRDRKILRRDRYGRVSDFVSSAQDGFLSGLGIDVDVERRRLWAVGVFDEKAIEFSEEERGRTGIWGWNIDDGTFLGRWDAPLDSVQRGFNDLAVMPDGGVVVTDASGGTLYRLDAALSSFEPVFDDATLRGPNGITPTADGTGVYVAEYVYGITHVDLTTGERTRLGSPADVTLIGVDGLKIHEGTLIAVQNYAGLDRAARFTLADDGLSVTACEVLEARHPRMDDPTTGVVAGGGYWFIANSHITGFDPSAPVPGVEEWTKLLILRAQL